MLGECQFTITDRAITPNCCKLNSRGCGSCSVLGFKGFVGFMRVKVLVHSEVERKFGFDFYEILNLLFILVSVSPLVVLRFCSTGFQRDVY